MEIKVRNEPRCPISTRHYFGDTRPFVVYVDGVKAIDRSGRERRFQTREAARKALSA